MRVAVKNIRRLIILVDQGRRTTRFGRDRLPQPGKLLLIVIPDPVLLISARRHRTPRNTFIDRLTQPTFALALIPGFPQPYDLHSPVTPQAVRSQGRMDQSQVVHNAHISQPHFLAIFRWSLLMVITYQHVYLDITQSISCLHLAFILDCKQSLLI
jgi:hypothetical protein